MKKYITIAALLAAGTAFANAEFDATKAQEYKLDFSASAPYLGGVQGGSITLADVEIADVSTKAMTGGTGYWETETALMYDMLSATLESASRSVSFSMQIFWTGGSSDWQSFLHVGQNDTGITLGMDTDGGLCFAAGNQYNAYKITAQLTQNQWNDVTFTLNGDSTTTIQIGDNTYNGKNISITDMNWAEEVAERNKFSLGCRAPGWTNQYNLDSNTKVANISVCYVPEPSAFGLLAGLGALALVASRRRRK